MASAAGSGSSFFSSEAGDASVRPAIPRQSAGRVLAVALDGPLVERLRAACAGHAEVVALETGAQAVEAVRAGRAAGPDAPAGNGPSGAGPSGVPRVGTGRPTLAVLGHGVPHPFGVVQSLHPHPLDLGVLVLTAPADDSGEQDATGADPAASLALLIPTAGAGTTRILPADQTERLHERALDLLGQIARARRHAELSAAAQRAADQGGELVRQPGAQVFGPLLGEAPVAAVLLDPSARLVAWNHAARRLLALSEPDSLGRRFASWFPHDAAPAVADHVCRADATPATFPRTAADGSHRLLRLLPQRLARAEGAEQILLLVEDVTQEAARARRAEELADLAELRARVAAALLDTRPLAERLTRCLAALAAPLDIAFAGVWLAPPMTWETHGAQGGPQGDAAREGQQAAAQVDRLGTPPGTPLLYAHHGTPFTPSTGDADGADVRLPDPVLSALNHGRPAADDLAADDCFPFPDWARATRATCYVVFPMRADGGVLGALTLYMRRMPSDALLAELATTAGHMAAAIRLDAAHSTAASTPRRSEPAT